MKSILTVRLRDRNLLKRLKMDALGHNVALQDYAAVCFEAFLSQPVALRRIRVSHRARPKIVGRKVRP